MTLKTLSIATVSAAILTQALVAQEPLAGHSGHGEVFNEGPRQAAYLMPGCGDVHFPISCSKPQTQKFFRQGVGQLHGFWHFEAERSFRQAAAIEPDSAMNYWGMAMANVDNPDRAAGFIEQAVVRREQATPRERLWIDMLAKYYEVTPASAKKAVAARAKAADKSGGKPAKRKFKKSKKVRSRDLTRGYEAVLHEYPEDVEAMAFLANRIWLNRRAGLSTNSHMVVELLLRRVFELSPNHPAHHYRIHLWDREDAKRALVSAQVSGQAAPAVAHQWHMSGHIFAKLHRHEDAVYQQSASARVDHAHMMRDAVMPYKIHNYGHNNEWLCRSLNHCGRARDALGLAANMVELPRHPEDNKVSKRSSISGYGVRRIIETCRNFHLVSELRSFESRGYLTGGESESTELAVIAELGEAYFLAGDPALGRVQIERLEAMKERAEARAEKAKADKKAKKAAAEKAGDAEAEKGEAKAGEAKKAVAKAEADPETETKDAPKARKSSGEVRASSVERRLKVLRGLDAVARGDEEEARKLLKKARLAKFCLASCYSKLGDHDEACKLVDAEAKRNPNRVEILARQVWIRHEAGKEAEARESFDALRKAAGRGDLGTPILARLAPIAERFGYPADWRTPRVAAHDVGIRPTLDSLGPFRWQPTPAAGFSLPAADGRQVALQDYSGRPVLVIFYLGFGCLHCVEQLQHFHPMVEDYKKAGIDIVAIGTDSLKGMAKSLENLGPERFGFPLLADPEMVTFKKWRAFDDFEKIPLHGTFLVDGAGLVRWSDISYEPFDRPEYLLEECRRILRLGGE